MNKINNKTIINIDSNLEFDLPSIQMNHITEAEIKKGLKRKPKIREIPSKPKKIEGGLF